MFYVLAYSMDGLFCFQFKIFSHIPTKQTFVVIINYDIGDDGFFKFNLDQLHPLATLLATRPKDAVPKFYPQFLWGVDIDIDCFHCSGKNSLVKS